MERFMFVIKRLHSLYRCFWSSTKILNFIFKTSTSSQKYKIHEKCFLRMRYVNEIFIWINFCNLVSLRNFHLAFSTTLAPNLTFIPYMMLIFEINVKLIITKELKAMNVFWGLYFWFFKICFWVLIFEIMNSAPSVRPPIYPSVSNTVF